MTPHTRKGALWRGFATSTRVTHVGNRSVVTRIKMT